MLLGDLQELKRLIDVPLAKTNEDAKLLFFLDYSTNLIEEFFDRTLVFKQRTEYLQGTGTAKMLLRYRPVNPNPPYSITLLFDDFGAYGQSPNGFADPTTQTLTYGTDYIVEIDSEDNTSRCGILQRINEVWNKPTFRQTGLLSPFIWDDTGSYKVTYWGGYTVDNVPAGIRFACTMMAARMRYLMPLGMELGTDTYEERSISITAESRNYIFSPTIRGVLNQYRNWKFV